ncbi:hypothetical protein [Bacillus sp. Marseille-Q1617]|uniref:hypothetical protein n=1 Tax=Bacillus sp. Marseille-Q1617 TaxID=2736887 RepID=UPI0020CA6AAF|nr:hypothetical protein [Bacillus sp. Marseille-Q1617]
MKIMGISLLMLGCLMAFSLSLDILQGFDISQAWQNTVSPFQVMEVVELFVLYFLLFLFFAETAYYFIKGKKKTGR